MNEPQVAYFGSPGEEAKCISGLYQLHSLAFAHPVHEFHERVVDNSLQKSFDQNLGLVGLAPANLPAISELFSEYESNYISLFQVGQGGHPPCSLYAGDYNIGLGTRGEQLLHLSQFYKHCGLKLSEDEEERDQPDHLICELEMMAFLAFREGEAEDNGKDPTPYRLAQRDFLVHHLDHWIPTMAQRAQDAATALDIEPFLPALAHALKDLVIWHRNRLSENLEGR